MKRRNLAEGNLPVNDRVTLLTHNCLRVVNSPDTCNCEAAHWRATGDSPLNLKLMHLVVALLLGFAPASVSAQTVPDFAKHVRPILQAHCYQCHGPEKQNSEVRFDTLSTDLIKDRPAAETWHDALNSVNLGEMPPDDEPQLSVEDRGILTSWIRQQLDAAVASQKSTGGEVILRRLNRVEYQNTMVDLLGVDTDYSSSLPPDTPSEEGFQNNGASLSISPMAFEYYLASARMGLSKAIVTGPAPEVIAAKITETMTTGTRRDVFSKTLNVGGKFVAKLDEFPDAGEFHIRVTARAHLIDEVAYPRMRATFGFRADTQYPTGDLGVVDVTSEQPAVYEFRGRMEDFPVQSRNQSKFPGQLITLTNDFNDGKQRAPTRRVQIETEKKNKKGKITKKKSTITEIILHEDVPTITIDSVEFTGPLYEAWPPKHHQVISLPSPQREVGELVYAKEVVAAFMRRAYRRPVQDFEVNSMLRLFSQIRPMSASFEDAIRETLALVLVSPDFLYLVEPENGDGIAKAPLSDFEFASRLSYFLWSTMPDARLFELAESGTLRDPAILTSEIDRMLADERSWQFVSQFTNQWLDLASVDRVAVNPQYYENWDTSIEPWMQEETRHFFAEVLRNDLSALNFIDSDFAMLNAPMARHYGIANGPRGSSYERVRLPTHSKRGGLLGHASMLLGNSTGEDSHPIMRAVWIRERLLDDPPAPPPPNVPALDSENPDFNQLPVRAQLEIHRQDPNCADCHRGIDPWGIALEHYDAVGNWRDSIKRLAGKRQRLLPVNTETTLPGGHPIDGVDDLKAFLIEHRSEQFAKAIVSRVTSYALGRSIEFADEGEVDKMRDQFVESDYQLRPLIHAIVNNELFQTK